MEYKNDVDEKDKNNSNIDRLLYLKQQQNIIERARESIEKFKVIEQLQKQVIKLEHDKWNKMDGCVEAV